MRFDKIKIIALIAAILALSSISGYYFFHTYSTKGRITSTSWSHTETLEQKYTYTDSGWRHSAQWGSYDFVGCQRKYYGIDCDIINEQTVCSPEYKTYCSGWKYDRWVVLRTEIKEGESFECKWPSIVAAHEQRVIKIEKYFVKFDDESNEYNFHPSTEEEYLKFREKGIWNLRVNRAKMVWPEQRNRPH